MTLIRRGWIILSLAALLLAATGCGAARPTPPTSATPTSAPGGHAPTTAAPSPTTVPTAAPVTAPGAQPTSAPTAVTAARFPVTIEHKFGRTTIPAEPKRVMTLGYTEQDPVLALGVKPIAVREWFGDQPYAVWPWAQDKRGDAKPQVLKMPFGELDFEAIAALKPDLILATYSGIKQEEYGRLAQIAPTVAQTGAYVDFGVPWQEQTLVIGRALGREERAKELVAEVEATFAAVRKQYPEFVGASGIVAAPAPNGQYFLYGPEDGRSRVLASLGFKMPAAIAERTASAFYTTVSGEQLSLLDVNVLIWQVNSPEERAAVESNPLYQQLKVAREGRAIFIVSYEPLRGALGFSTVLSLPFMLDRLVPQLAAAIDGDPATRVTP